MTPTTIDTRRWLQLLHLFYAGLFAFVLPFICWGAQATPGHPHALAHFVFAPPALKATAAAEGMDAAAWLAQYAQHEICTVQPAAPEQNRGGEPAQLPPGRSIPSLLSISFLAVISLFVQFGPVQAGRPGTRLRLSTLNLQVLALQVATPPPR